MKTNGTIQIVSASQCNVEQGHFNGGEHLIVEIEPGRYQTISCKLPNGKFVTFAFVPAGPTDGPEMECVDIHTTAGVEFINRNGNKSWQQNLIGFTVGPDTFDSRHIKTHTALTTLLVHSRHNDKDEYIERFHRTPRPQNESKKA